MLRCEPHVLEAIQLPFGAPVHSVPVGEVVDRREFERAYDGSRLRENTRLNEQRASPILHSVASAVRSRRIRLG